MQLRMLQRRSLNGSMTVVGDIAQSTGAWAHADWEEVLEHLPERRPARRAELTIGYRLPGPTCTWPPACLERGRRPACGRRRSVRQAGDEPRFRCAAEPGRLGERAGRRCPRGSGTPSTPAAWP